MNKTPLFEAHVVHGAKLVDFAGWDMPLQFAGVIEEYHAVRRQAGFFDVSHMGRFIVSGEGALSFLQIVTTNDVAALDVHQSHYSMVCNSTGGVKDDIFVYRLGTQNFLLCVNANNREKILEWLRQEKGKVSEKVDISDRTTEMAQLALQGPESKSILMNADAGEELEKLKPRRCLETSLFDTPVLITRTGYTGELGYELYVPADRARLIWDQVLTVGVAHGLKPAGLGARDLLRLEMGYFLYGNDLTEETTPVEAGAEWVVAIHKNEFIGAEVLKKQKQDRPHRRLIAFELLKKSVPRHGMAIYDEDKPIGEVTSGNLSPILQKGIGLGYVSSQYSEVGSRVQVDVRGKLVPAVVVKAPFYHKKALGQSS